jgi:hypothetical protein
VPAWECGPCRLCIKLYPGIHLTTEENYGKTSVGEAKSAKLQIVGHDSFGRLGAVSRATPTDLPDVITFGLRLW